MKTPPPEHEAAFRRHAPADRMKEGDAKIGPNTTAPAKARSVTAMSNGAFPIGDAKHARLAIGGATRSERAGNITDEQMKAIKAKAQRALANDPGDHEYR